MDTKSRFRWPRQLFPLLLFILPLCGAARGQGVHLTMGNPSNAVTDTNQPANYLLSKSQYALSYHRDNGRPNWVSWHLDQTWLGNAPRQNDFRNDTTLPAGWYQVQGSDFSGSGFDRGHMCPSADRTATVNDNSATFLMTNMVAQLPATNQGPWADMENYLRTLVTAGNELYIISGGVGLQFFIANGHVAVPAQTWKVVLVLPSGTNDVSRVTTSTRTIAVIMPNSGAVDPNWRNYQVTVDQVETATGYDFFSNVPVAIQNVIEGGIPVPPTTCTVDNAISFSVGNYTQNFDALSGALPAGFFISEGGGGARDNEDYTFDTGASPTGDTYAYATAALPADKALGSLTSGSLNPAYYGLCLKNDSGAALSNLSVTYTGEQYRLGESPQTLDKLDFQYSLTATAVGDTGWTDADALDLPSPVTSGAVGLLDGNSPSNRTLKSGTLSGFNWSPGGLLFLRWADTNVAGSDNGLAVDELTIAPAAPTAIAGVISGRVVSDSGRPIANAVVNARAFASGATVKARTDSKGLYELSLPVGSAFVSVTHPRYFFANNNRSIELYGNQQVNFSGTELPLPRWINTRPH